jgi:hypothetical protein
MFAHVAGIPVEETLLSFGPAVGVAAGVALIRLRTLRSRLRLRLRQRRPQRD